MDYFRYGFDASECEEEAAEIYEEYDIETAKEEAIAEFNQGFRRYDAAYRAQREVFLEELEITLNNKYRDTYEEYLKEFYNPEIAPNREYSEEFLKEFNEMMGTCFTDSDGIDSSFAAKFDEIANGYLDQLKTDFQ
jgi:transketolase